MSESCASRSTILPLPSSPHCAPTMTVAGTNRSLGGGLGYRRFRTLDAYRVPAPAEERAVIAVELEPAGEGRTRIAFGRVEVGALDADRSERGGAGRDQHHLFAERHDAARSANFA